MTLEKPYPTDERPAAHRQRALHASLAVVIAYWLCTLGYKLTHLDSELHAELSVLHLTIYVLIRAALVTPVAVLLLRAADEDLSSVGIRAPGVKDVARGCGYGLLVFVVA